MNRFRYRQLLLLVALIVPSVVVAELGRRNFGREQEMQKIVISLIAQEVSSRLDHIKDGARTVSSRLPGTSPDPAVMLLASVVQSNGKELELNPEEWKPYGKDGLWLSRISDDSGAPLVIAVRGQDIVRQVQDDLRANGNAIAFQITSEENTSHATPGNALVIGRGQPLGRRFPGLQIIFDSKEIIQYELAVQQRFYYTVSFALILGLTLLGWHLLLRDSLREARNTEMRAQFVSNVAHELKTPLTAIRTFAETLQIRSSSDPKIQKEFLDIIVSESERLTRLLKNVLDFSLIERGQRTYQLKHTRLAEVAQSAARTMRFPLSQQGFDFHVDIVDDFPSIPLDRDALEQVILNLLSNAMKYSGESRQIALKLRSDNGSALIQVVDCGVGIAPAECKRIFERYYRVASPENRSIAGSGLGLALIVHVVEGHGGTVEVESVLGAGSTFSIRIPFNGNGHS